MEISSYCGNLACELKGWQDKLQNIVGRIDGASCGEKTFLMPQVNELHMILEEFNDRIHLLKTECSTSWTPGRTAIMGSGFGMTSTGSEVWQDVSPGDFGG